MAALQRRGARITIVLDSLEAARFVTAKSDELSVPFPALIEIDSDDHRSGVRCDDERLVDIGRALGGSLRGVMTHAGESYRCASIEAIRELAEQERAAVVRSADRLRGAGLSCPVVSVGSTPTATCAARLDGVTEVRAGVFMFFDLVMAGLGVCEIDDIAVSVLTTVIGHQREKNWIIADAGWMALSRDRGTATQKTDQGYGLVCDQDGQPIPDLLVIDTNQEHGIVASRDRRPIDLSEFPIGRQLRVLPNHACATAAQHNAYQVISGGTEIEAVWRRFQGW